MAPQRHVISTVLQGGIYAAAVRAVATPMLMLIFVLDIVVFVQPLSADSASHCCYMILLHVLTRLWLGWKREFAGVAFEIMTLDVLRNVGRPCQLLLADVTVVAGMFG